MAEPGPGWCLFFLVTAPSPLTGSPKAQASKGQQLAWGSIRKIKAVEELATPSQDTVQGAPGRLSDTLFSSPRALFLGWGGLNYSLWGRDPFPFLHAPLLISFGAGLLLAENTACLRQSVHNSSSRKQAFEEKASDQNKERQWEGGAAEAQPGGAIRATRAVFDIHTQHHSVASLIHRWGWGESSCKEVKWLRRKARHTSLKWQWSQQSFSQSQRVLSRAGCWEAVNGFMFSAVLCVVKCIQPHMFTHTYGHTHILTCSHSTYTHIHTYIHSLACSHPTFTFTPINLHYHKLKQTHTQRGGGGKQERRESQAHATTSVLYTICLI